MELRALNTFIIAAEKMNFTKAGEQLGYTQAAVSIQIKQLEEEVGTPLFDRIGRNIHLTQTGREFLIRAQNIIRYTEDTVSYITDKTIESGMIRIGTSESILSFVFPEIVKKFHKIYPDVQISVRTDIRETIFSALNHNEIDFAYTIDLDLIDHNWVGRTVHEEKVLFVASPLNPLTKKKGVTITDILEQELAITETNVGYSYALYQILAKRNLYPKPFLESGNTDFLKQIVMDNQAVSYLPLFTIQDELDKGLILPIGMPEFEVSVYGQLYWHKSKYLTKPMLDFMTLIDGFYNHE